MTGYVWLTALVDSREIGREVVIGAFAGMNRDDLR
jgi:hypothetical protein